MAIQSGWSQAFIAYFVWGLFPIYWYFLRHVPALEILAHRIIWSVVILGLIVMLTQRREQVKTTLKDHKQLKILAVTAVLVTANWLLYIWSVSNGHVIQASLGYYITPLVNISLGAIFLRERLRKRQYYAVALATTGVGVLTVSHGQIPVIALTLALTFGFYTLLRKYVTIGAQASLLLETTLMFLPAVGYLLWLGERSISLHETWGHQLLLIGGGVVTIIPLVCLANALKVLPLSTIGFFQYLSPTLQFLCGIFIFNEPFGTVQLVSFCFIWLALLVYTIEAIRYSRKGQ